ncbi:MAG: hypothetical protein ACI9D1_001421, partial [Cryomorphaceae bacterium]
VQAEDRRGFIEAHFAERLHHYQEAHIRFDSANVSAEKLAELVRVCQRSL